MTELRVPVDVPESRQVTINLPLDVPVGPTELVLTVGSRQPIIVLTPTLPPLAPATSDDKWENEHQSFLKLLPDLLQTHRGQYVAVHEGKVVDSGPVKADVALRAYRTFGKIPMCIRLVTEQPPPPVRIPSFRRLHNRRS